MKGRVLGYDTTAQATVVRAEDNQRYRFSPFEWREASPPRRGDEVDFEPDGDRARDVYRTKSAPLDAPSARPPGSPQAAAGDTPAQIVLRQPLMRFLVARPVFSAALLVLVACLFSAFAIDGVRLSVFSAPDLAWRMSNAVNELLASSGPDPGPRLAGAAARISAVFLLLLYAVPALAAYVVWREFIGQPDLRTARLAGIAAMALPVALPGLVVLIVQVGVLPGLPEIPVRLGRDGLSSPTHAFHPVQLYAGGTVLLVVAGFALWEAASGRLRPWLAAIAQSATAGEAAVPEVAEDRAADFRPQYSRQPAAAAPPQHQTPAAAPRPAPPEPTAPPRVHPAAAPPPDHHPAAAPSQPAPTAGVYPVPPQSGVAPPPQGRAATTDEGALRRTGAAVAASSHDAMAALSERLRRAITGDGGNNGKAEDAETPPGAAQQPRLRDVLRDSPYRPAWSSPDAEPAATQQAPEHHGAGGPADRGRQ